MCSTVLQRALQRALHCVLQSVEAIWAIASCQRRPSSFILYVRKCKAHDLESIPYLESFHWYPTHYFWLWETQRVAGWCAFGAHIDISSQSIASSQFIAWLPAPKHQYRALLLKRPIILSILLTVATPYLLVEFHNKFIWAYKINVV